MHLTITTFPTSLLFLIALISGCSKPPKEAPVKPNILFIAVDDLRPELNCYGRAHIKSPNIDRLAQSGTMFTRAYVQVPVCGASRASLMSGVRPTANRFVTYFTRVDEDFPGVTSLPKHLKDNGYTTISLGKIYHHANDDLEAWTETPWIPKPRNPEYGWFDYLDSTSLRVVRENRAKPLNGADNPLRGPAFEFPDVADTAYKDGRLAMRAIGDLNRLAKAGDPFFLAVGFQKPHLPFNAPKKYWDLYKGDIPMSPNNFRPEGVPDAAIHSSGELRNYGLIPRTGPVSADTARLLTQGYYACVSYTDAQIGKILDAIDELGLRENTIVILWGDHGWNLEDHTMWCKHANFETSMRAPLIISATGQKGNQSSSALVEFVDIYPTLCELAGLPLPSHLDGESLVPLLAKPNQEFKEAIFSRFIRGESVKTDQYVYSEWINPDSDSIYARMLYDHAVDSLENNNVAEDFEYSDVVKQLSQRLADQRRKSAAKTL